MQYHRKQHTVRRTASLFLLAASIAGLVGVGCDKGHDNQPNAAATLGAVIARAATTQPHEKIDLARLTDFDWDRLYIFGPHSKRDEIESALGFDWPGVSKTKIAKSDEVTLLVFTKDKAVAGWLEYPRLKADFSFVASSKGYTREEARFAIKSENTWPVVAQTRASATP
jgi:hypothetical protein